MFQLLQPVYLFAMAGIIIPVIIHLWNIREGKTLKVGSISLLQETARQQARCLKLKDLLLLLLRCLLITVLAFLVARPVWQTQLSSGNEKGWLLVEKEGLKEAYRQHQPTIDSLLKAGYKFHYFTSGFPAEEWQKAFSQTVDSTIKPTENYWTLLKELNEQVPSDLPVYLFTSNQLNKFSGTRPGLSMKLNWQTYPLPDTINKQVVEVVKTATDSMLAIVANSKPTITYYTFENFNKAGTSGDVSMDTSAMNIAIYDDQNTLDAFYLRAAIDAIAKTANRQINTTIIQNGEGINKQTDWLFWLSEKPLPQQVPANIFLYAKGKEENVASFVSTSDKNTMTSEIMNVSKLVAASENESVEAIWKDAGGKAILTRDKSNATLYRFYSRFNPLWNNLPWSSDFVNMIYDLLISKNEEIKNYDRRIIDETQMQVNRAENKKFDKQKFIERTDLSKIFWLLAFVLFFLERYISLTRKPGTYA